MPQRAGDELNAVQRLPVEATTVPAGARRVTCRAPARPSSLRGPTPEGASVAASQAAITKPVWRPCPVA